MREHYTTERHKERSPLDSIQTKAKRSSNLFYNYDDIDEEEEEEENINYKPLRKKKKQYSTSPEPPTTPTTPKKQRDPNRKDKIGRTKLFQATTAGHLDKVIELIDQGANVNFKDNANWTPLHEAANNGRFEIAQYLIKCGAKINVRGYGLDTPLHDACQSNSTACVQLLVDAGADVFALNEKNQRPVDLCTSDSCKSIVTTKMKKLDNVIRRDGTGKSLLHHACLNNQCKRARDLIQQGADVNAKDNQEATPLHLACAKGHFDVVQLLFQQGALVNILGTELGDTPLHQASRYGHDDIVRYLIDHAEADVNMENKSRKNAYQVAASFPKVRQILTARMDESRFEKEACHALDETARKMALQNEPERQLTREERKIQSYMKVFAKLEGSEKDALDDLVPLPSPISTTSTRRKRKSTISRKSASVERDLSSPTSPSSSTSKRSIAKLDPFKKDTSGGTQLHKFASRGDCDIVQQLLESGARPNETDYAGWTALHEAALKGHLEVVKLLLKYGANPNVKGGDSDTPLHDATENNHCDIVELLLEHGADPFARNINNAEPLDIAIHHEFQDIILVLQNANPVKKKKRTKVKKEMSITDDVVISNSSSSNTSSSANTTTKKRRLIQAAELESSDNEEEPVITKPLKLKKLRQRSSSPELVHVKLEEVEETAKDIVSKEKENINNKVSKNNNSNNKKSIPMVVTAPRVIDNNQIYRRHHSPIHTPPPEQWTKQKQNAKSYSPLYTIQPPTDIKKNYVVDLQVTLFLGFNTVDEFWKRYSDLFLNQKKFIHADIQSKLWPTLKVMLLEEKSTFMARSLNFIMLEDVMELIKRDYHHLLENNGLITTIDLDVGYQENTVKKQCSLPPKIAMKMKKCGYKFQQYSTS